ncbi:hypothetical protein HCH_02694 [Hahella chejuensis KCTC 2396]|uniref:Uncharacterized protein n=1 Tax=Hahella chejuensis (strain KCTC 2396) TaxID=349521 RepID=Q2SIP3_HAHCH|nr:hypothetical protein HCH_02694 [Hahella chejuensis KCTC 2396]
MAFSGLRLSCRTRRCAYLASRFKSLIIKMFRLAACGGCDPAE